MCTSRVHAHPRKNIKIDSAGQTLFSRPSNPGTLRNKVEKEKREFRIEFLQPFSKNSIEKQKCLFLFLFLRIKDEVKGRVISPPPLSNASCQRKFPYSFRIPSWKMSWLCPFPRECQLRGGSSSLGSKSNIQDNLAVLASIITPQLSRSIRVLSLARFLLLSLPFDRSTYLSRDNMRKFHEISYLSSSRIEFLTWR